MDGLHGKEGRRAVCETLRDSAAERNACGLAARTGWLLSRKRNGARQAATHRVGAAVELPPQLRGHSGGAAHHLDFLAPVDGALVDFPG